MGLTSLLFLLSLPTPSLGIKFVLPASRYPSAKCIWNAVHDNQLVIVTANIGAAPSSAAYAGSSSAAADKASSSQRVDIEIIDSSPKKNVYLHKKGIKGETRLAITTHADGEVGVCLKNYVEDTATTGEKLSRIVDLDVDIGADAIDYK
jgi:p24 family protein delta-1